VSSHREASAAAAGVCATARVTRASCAWSGDGRVLRPAGEGYELRRSGSGRGIARRDHREVSLLTGDSGRTALCWAGSFPKPLLRLLGRASNLEAHLALDLVGRYRRYERMTGPDGDAPVTTRVANKGRVLEDVCVGFNCVLAVVLGAARSDSDYEERAAALPSSDAAELEGPFDRALEVSSQSTPPIRSQSGISGFVFPWSFIETIDSDGDVEAVSCIACWDSRAEDGNNDRGNDH
jgi:hypothetical protein